MSISKTVQDYINERFSLKDCVAKRLVNFSELARQIIKESRLDSKYFNAVMVAANRYSLTLKENKDNKISQLLKKSKLHVRAKVARFVFAPHAQIYDDIKEIHIIKGMATTTVIVDQEHYEHINNKYGHYVLDQEKDLVEIAIVSPPDADKVPGVTAFLTGLLSSNGINILTTLGSYTDDVFIIRRDDLGKAVEVLERVIGI